MLRLLITLVIIGGAVSQKPKCGMCPTIAPMMIDPVKISGEWLEWKRSTTTEDDTASCEKLSFFPPDENGVTQLTFSSLSTLIGGNSTLAGMATFDQNKVSVDLHLPVLGIMKNMSYYVIDIVYDKYYVVWSCEQLKNKYIPKVYVKVRNVESACGIDAIVENALMKQKLPRVPMTKENRAHCPCNS